MAYFSSLLRVLLLAGLPLGAALAQTTTGGVGIGTTTPNAAAALDVSSTTQGVLLPRLTLSQRNALTASTTAPPVAGLVIYQTDNTPGLYAYDGANWGRLGGDNLGNHTATQALNLQGNALIGTGSSISGLGVGVRADGGLNLGQNGNQNVLLGFLAGAALTSGSTNVLVGAGSGQSITTGSSNVFSGYQSGYNNTTGGSNTFSGLASGYSNTTGSYNVFSGNQSGNNNTTGANNVFSGYQNGYSNTTGSYNVFSGNQSGYSNTTGSYNVFSGYASGYNNTTGGNNTFSGYGSGSGNTTGANNTFSGYQSGQANTTGGNNTFSGLASGYSNTTGSGNTFVGNGSGSSNATGTNLTVLGVSSGPSVDGLTNATAVGANVGLTQSNTVVLGNGANVGIGTSAPAGGLHLATGNSGPGTGTATAGAILSGGAGATPYLELRGSGTGSSTTPYIDFAEGYDQDYATRLISVNGTLNVNGNNTLLLKVNGNVQATNVVYTSDARFKTDVRPLTGALASVLALRGVRYHWNALGVAHGGQAGAGQVGLLAQELEKVYPELVSTGPDGYKAVNYAQLAPVLIEALKEQQAQLELLKQQTATATQQAAAATQRANQAEASLGSFEQRLRALEAGTGQAQASK